MIIRLRVSEQFKYRPGKKPYRFAAVGHDGTVIPRRIRGGVIVGVIVEYPSQGLTMCKEVGVDMDVR